MGGVREVLALDDRPAILLEADAERVGDPFSVGLGVGSHTDLIQVQLVIGVVRHGWTLEAVGGGGSAVIVGAGWAQILGERVAGSLAVDVGHAARRLRDG